MQRRVASKLVEVLSSRSGGLYGPAESTLARAAAQHSATPSSAAAASAAAYYHPAAAAAAAAPPSAAAVRAYSAPASAKSTQNVPLGHHDSDLSNAACHIGLGRRRDLTMREDLGLWKNGTSRVKLADVFKGAKCLLVGFPGGKVCTETHIPGYVKAVPELKAAGVDKVVCVTVGDPAQVHKWATDNGFEKDTTLCVFADKDQGFMRLLGLELGPAGAQCQRFAAVVDNGILLRLKVEATPGELKHCDAKSMLATFKQFFGTN